MEACLKEQNQTENQGHFWGGEEGTRHGGEGPKPIPEVVNFYKEIIILRNFIIKINKQEKHLSLLTVSLTPIYVSVLSQITPLHDSSTQFPEHALFLLPNLFSAFSLPECLPPPPLPSQSQPTPQDSRLSII